MKITKQYLKQVIKEELERITEEEIPTLPDLIDSVEAFLKRGDNFRSSSYYPTLKWYIERHDKKDKLYSLLNQAFSLSRNIKKSPAPGIGPRATKVDPNDPTLLNALKLTQTMKELASQE